MAAVKKINKEAVEAKELEKQEVETVKEVDQETLDELITALDDVNIDEKYILEHRDDFRSLLVAAKRLRSVFGANTAGPVIELTMFLQLESIKKSLEIIAKKLDK